LRRFEQDRKLAASKIEGVDRQRRQVDRDIDNVQSVIATSREFQALLDEVIGKLAAEHGVELAGSHKEAA